MRRGSFFVLMVVLVLRGLTGTAMAAGVLPPLAMTQIAASHPHEAAAAQQAAHDGDTSHHSPAANVAGHCADGSAECHPHEHATCSACEICHSAMLAAPGVCTPATRLPSAHLRHTPAPLHNAPAALLIKPPIA